MAESFVNLSVPCYNLLDMDDPSHEDLRHEAPTAPERASGEEIESPAEKRARRWLIGGAIVVALILAGLVTLMVFLSINAYRATRAGVSPSPGSVVVSLVRDTAIVFVAFESLVIGVLLIVLMLQLQSLIVLLRDEIRPMLEAANETMTTVRGTTQFVSHSVVSPVVKWSGYVAGVGRILRQVSGLRRKDDET
ncbi:MAG: hypothetical protein PVJ55_09235 [Anaerolineae bacterium]